MRDELLQTIASAVKDLFKLDVSPVLTTPDEQFGDYATNVALQLAAKTGQPPRVAADKLAEALKAKLQGQLSDISVAGPGFINFKLSEAALAAEIDKVDANYGSSQAYKNKVVVAEYSDPNPFKVLHAGHLYTSVVGDAIANLFEAAGAKVHRVNFGGDVGLHVAKTMWAIHQKLGGWYPEKLKDVPKSQRADWLTEEYIRGSFAYGEEEEFDKQRRQEIQDLNRKIYQIQKDNDRTSDLAKIYWETRQWSYDHFEEFYQRIGSGFEKYYPESEVAELGVKTVQEQLQKGVFVKSDGAVIFPGDQHDLHVRVFINSEGLPTYEAKDVGLILHKWQDYKFDTSLVITGNEQAQYMQVVLKALQQFEPELAKKTVHLTHGLVKLKGGVKMSSRKGNILRAMDVLDAAAKANHQLSGKEQPAVVLGAVKYAFLKQGMGGDIIYDPEESVAIQGNSGPYLQYAHARARSILSKAQKVDSKQLTVDSLEVAERSLARKITEYPEVVQKSVKELAPHHICTYLYELAQKFNQFYEHNRVIGDQREALRLQLIEAYAQVLTNGLGLLNIESPERM